MPIKNIFALLLTALIWGTAFVAQTQGGNLIGPYTFNCLRSFIGAAALLPVILLLDYLGYSRPPQGKDGWKKLVRAGVCCGTALCVASNLQQLGLNLGTSAGKGGFLTACYIVLVPVLGIFLKRRCGWHIWLGVALTVGGLYLLCMQGESLSFVFSDVLVLLCALGFACHIMVIDKFVGEVDAVRMSALQFLVTGLLTALPMYVLELDAQGFATWWIAVTLPLGWSTLCFAGVMSSGVAYTLQIIGQKGLNPTVASLLMSLESVFAVLAGWAILDEQLSSRELWGCGLIFAAVVLAQLPISEDE